MSKVLDMWSGMTGTVLDYAGSSAPAGWLLCFGQSLLRADYPVLFAAIGTTFGAADGTHFNVPDCRGRVAAGKDDMGGAAAGVLNVSLSGTRASTSSGVITGLSSTAALAKGMVAFGTGIGAAAVISSIDSGTQVTLSVNSSSTGTATIRFGVVDGATLGAAGGSQVHTMVEGQMPLHGHAFRESPTAASPTASDATGGLLIRLSGAANQAAFTGTPTDTAGQQIGGTGGGQAHPNLAPSLILNKIIKT